MYCNIQKNYITVSLASLNLTKCRPHLLQQTKRTACYVIYLYSNNYTLLLSFDIRTASLVFFFFFAIPQPSASSSSTCHFLPYILWSARMRMRHVPASVRPFFVINSDILLQTFNLDNNKSYQ